MLALREARERQRHPPSSRESEEDMPRIDAHRERRPGGKPGCAYVVGGAFVPYDMLDAGVGTGLDARVALHVNFPGVVDARGVVPVRRAWSRWRSAMNCGVMPYVFCTTSNAAFCAARLIFAFAWM